MVLSGILTRATYGRERIYGHADVTAANGLERGPGLTAPVRLGRSAARCRTQGTGRQMVRLNAIHQLRRSRYNGAPCRFEVQSHGCLYVGCQCDAHLKLASPGQRTSDLSRLIRGRFPAIIRQLRGKTITSPVDKFN